MPPTTENRRAETVAWVNREAAQYAHQGLVPGAEDEKDAIRDWRQHRPMMWHRLGEWGILDKMAFVLSQKCQEAMNRYLTAGMPPTDAREQAVKEWMSLGPEEDPDQS